MTRAETIAAVFMLLLSSPGLLNASQSAPPSAPLMGYSAPSSLREQQWETRFRALPGAQWIGAQDKLLSAYPHTAGSARDKQNIEWILAKFEKWGWNAHIETFYVLLPTPKQRVVELVAPVTYKARLEEPAIPVDPASN
ncbi:MAG: folate hydrolase, partial [Terriglobia bacterium]